MKIFKICDLKNINIENKKRIVALGFFDGLHIAHQKIIKAVVKKSMDKNVVATLITFDKSPKEYFNKSSVKLVMPIRDKLKLLKKLGIKEVYLLKFNENIRNISKEKFVDFLLNKLNAQEVYCGYDYKFGYKGEGTPYFIESYSNNKIKVNILDKLALENEKISTTKLKSFILNGEFEIFKKLTNRNYKISGKVIRGKQLGRTINFPTANLQLDYDYIIPKKLGVYITRIKIKNSYYYGITNIGNNPTVSFDKDIFIETYILNFDEEIYGEKIDIYFYKFLREEQKFLNLEELKRQLELDKKNAEIFIANIK